MTMHLAAVALAFLAGGAAISLIFGSFLETHSQCRSVGREQPVAPSSSATKAVTGTPTGMPVLLEQSLPAENSGDLTSGLIPAGRRPFMRGHDRDESDSGNPDRKLRRRKKQARRRGVRNADEDASTTPNDSAPPSDADTLPPQMFATEVRHEIRLARMKAD